MYFKTENGILYSNDGSRLICVPSGKEIEYSIPQNVNHIDTRALYECSKITGILNGVLTLSENLLTIGESAFNGCTNLKGNIFIPSSVTSIGLEAFNNCKGFDENIIISGELETVGERAFASCTKIRNIGYSGTRDPKYPTSAFTGFLGSQVSTLADYQDNEFFGLKIKLFVCDCLEDDITQNYFIMFNVAISILI